MRKSDREKTKAEILKVLKRSHSGIPSEVLTQGEEAILKYKEQAVEEYLDRYEARKETDKNLINDTEKLDISSFIRERDRVRRGKKFF